MCGIAGFVGCGDAGDLARMSELLRHRGPDGCGEWRDARDAVYLAVRRLAVIDRTHAAQPLRAPDESLVLAYNGEIYNHDALRSTLETAGARFVTDHSDTEVLLHAYREWGPALTSRLNGMWAFAIYDARQHTLFMSRDRFGQKPLFYTRQAGTFAFASELSSLMQHRGLSRSVDSLSVQKYFAYGFIPAPGSLYRDVFKLPAGCSLTLNVQTLAYRITRHWDFLIEPDEAMVERPAEAAEQLRGLVRQAVHRQMRSDVPVGVFLSGGIDSSAIAHFAARDRDEPLDTFSVGFDHPAFDESAQARRVSTMLGTRHTSRTLTVAETQRVLPAIARLDEPIGDSSLICTYLLSEIAKARVTVALGGEGADELLGGYDPFRVLGAARWYARVAPRPVHRAIRLLAARLPSRSGYMSFDYRLTRLLRGLTYPPPLWNPVWIGALDPADLAECFNDTAPVERVYSEAIELWDSSPHHGLIERTMQFYVKLYFQDDILTKVDRAGMLNALEVRSPFLDLDLVNFVRRVPMRLLLRRGRTKHLFKDAMRPVLPGWIVDQRKHGFAVPMARWLREDWLTVDANAVPAGLNARVLRRKIDAHRAGTENNAVFLWSVWLLAQTTHATSRA